MAGESVLECRGLRRRFGELVAVDGVGFHIDPGETYGLLGPNGAGKTTSISMIAGLLEPDAGEVLVAGEPMTTRSVRAKNAIGYVPQDLAIYPDLTGRENLMFFARLYSMPTPAAKRRTDEVLALTGLADRARDQTKQYSGGMKRRLNIAIGLLHRLFGVNWGAPAGVAAVVVLFALVASGAGIFVGTLFRNEQQAIGVSLLLGLGLGALGGCMVPLEVFSPVMRRVAHVTPQAWGNDAFARLVGHGASITGILPQLGVLAAYAVVLLTLASWRLRRVLSG